MLKQPAPQAILPHTRLRAAARAFAWHLAFSIFLALLAALLVFGFWFPHPYRDLAGGAHLFWIMIGVDVVCGPLMTAILFNPKKSRAELTLDLSLVVVIQIAALAYGIYSISSARPVVVAFEVDRLVAVSAAQIDENDLPNAPKEFQALSWKGPQLVGTRKARDGQERLASLEMSFQGVEPSARPNWWQPYADSVPQVKERMRALTELRAQRPAEAQAAINTAVAESKHSIEALHYLPLTSQKMLDGWIVLLDSEAQIVGYAPVDGF